MHNELRNNDRLVHMDMLSTPHPPIFDDDKFVLNIMRFVNQDKLHCPYKRKRVSEENNQPKISIICQIWLCLEYLTIRNGSKCGERHFPEKPAEDSNARGQLPFYVCKE